MPMLNERFFGGIDSIIKEFLTSVMLGKQRSQMIQSVCYNVNRVVEWRHLIEVSLVRELENSFLFNMHLINFIFFPIIDRSR